MGKYYILIVEESIKVFSMVGHGQECKFSFASKGQPHPVELLEEGDKLLGYITNSEKRFAYIFSANKNDSGDGCQLIKLYETIAGPKIEEVPASIREEVFRNENTRSLFEISADDYQTIVSLMMGLSSDQFVPSVPPEREEKKTCLDVDLAPRTTKTHPLNCIIYGAPGTGKTYSTAEYALAIIENRPVDRSRKTPAQRKAVMSAYNEYIKKGQIVFTTFHQSYGYEEFIQGLRPDTNAGGISFITSDGVFKRISDNALNDAGNNYVIIIDEINRANISKVFGELITLIEADKRWGEINETCVTLQSGDVFAVPNNLYIIGTMNSADKSISLIDAALRRRFEFVEQYPVSSLIDDPVLKGVLEKINLILADSLESSDLLIGHSYFMGRTADNLCEILNNSIIPLLYEYYYDNKKKVIGVLSEALKGIDVKIIDEKISRVRVEKADVQE